MSDQRPPELPRRLERNEFSVSKTGRVHGDCNHVIERIY